MSRARKVRSGIVLAILTYCLFVGAQSVHAAEYSVRACNADQNSPVPFDRSFGYLFPFMDCPSRGIGFPALDPRWTMGPGFRDELVHTRLRDVVATSIKMRVFGGDTTDGIEYVLSGCSRCEPFATFGERTSESSDGEMMEFVVPDAPELTLAAICVHVDSNCTTGRPFYVREIQMTKVDAEAPHARAFFTPDEYDPQTREFHWFRPGEMRASYGFEDLGTGILRANVSIDGNEIWAFNGSCVDPTFSMISDDDVGPHYEQEGWFESDEICPAWAAGSGIVDFAGLEDGDHLLTMTAVDALNNEIQPFERAFGVDATAPSAPRNLRVDRAVSRNDNWTSDAGIKISWDASETVWDSEGSPRKDTWFQVVAPSGQATDPRIVWTESSGDLGLTEDGRWRMRTWFEDEAGNHGHPAEITVGLDTDAPATPQPIALPWLSLADVLRGARLKWLTPDQPALESGVCGHAVEVSDAEDAELSGAGDLISGTSTVLSGLHEGRQYAHLQAVSCADLKSQIEHVPVKVDLTGPTASLFGARGDDWSRSPVHLEIAAVDAHSGVAAISNRLDGGDENLVVGASAQLTIDNGVHQLDYSAMDRAGNSSSASRQTIRVDSVAPTGAFEPIDAASPAHISAFVDDETSGIDRAWIEVRRTDGIGLSVWRLVGAVSRPGDSSTRHVALNADLPDGTFEAGQYEFRIVAIDNAGNVGDSNGLRPDGAPLRVALPLREPATLTAMIATVDNVCMTLDGHRCGRRTDCKKHRCSHRFQPVTNGAANQRVLDFRDRPAIVGRITDSAGEPISGTALDIVETRHGASVGETIATVSSDSDGRYWARLRSGPSRIITVSRAGTPRTLPVSQRATLMVRAGASIKSSKRRLRAGDELVLSGRLLNGPADIPDGGKLVIIQYLNGLRWQPAIASPFTDSRGRFRVTWKSGPAPRPTKVYFRAMVPGEGWPYRTGISKPVAVRIEPR